MQKTGVTANYIILERELSDVVSFLRGKGYSVDAVGNMDDPKLYPISLHGKDISVIYEQNTFFLLNVPIENCLVEILDNFPN